MDGYELAHIDPASFPRVPAIGETIKFLGMVEYDGVTSSFPIEARISAIKYDFFELQILVTLNWRREDHL
jgi:hypothetical protein